VTKKEALDIILNILDSLDKDALRDGQWFNVSFAMGVLTAPEPIHPALKGLGLLYRQLMIPKKRGMMLSSVFLADHTKSVIKRATGRG